MVQCSTVQLYTLNLHCVRLASQGGYRLLKMWRNETKVISLYHKICKILEVCVCCSSVHSSPGNTGYQHCMAGQPLVTLQVTGQVRDQILDNRQDQGLYTRHQIGLGTRYQTIGTRYKSIDRNKDQRLNNRQDQGLELDIVRNRNQIQNNRQNQGVDTPHQIGLGTTTQRIGIGTR